MGIRRVVPDITTDDLAASREFYTGLLGFDVGMDLGWAVNLVSPTSPTAQIILFRSGESGPQPDMSIEVDDVDAVHQAALDRGLDIVYPLTDEEWGVRRFFVLDPNGRVVNVLSHRAD